MNETIGKPIKIILKTNIPNNHIIEFSKDNLYTPLLKDITGLSQYPFFTKAYKYDYSAIKSLSYNGVVNFFFNQKTFDQQVIASYGTRSTDKDIETHNINVMLSTLFKFNKSKIQDSISIINDNSNKQNENNLAEPPTFSMENFTKTFNTMFHSNANNVVNTGDDVYMSVNNEIYSPEKIVYINDAVNHPHYQKLLKGYIDFNKWLNSRDETDFIKIMYQYTFKQIEDNKTDFKNVEGLLRDLRKDIYLGKVTEQHQIEELEANGDELKKSVEISEKPEYISFKSLISEYNTDNTELKEHIKKMLEGKNNTLFTFLDSVINDTKTFTTNVVTNERNEQTIYVLIDFIKMDIDNKKIDNTNINCSNKSEKLGSILENILKGNKETSENRKNNQTSINRILKNKGHIYLMKEKRNIPIYYTENFNINDYKVNAYTNNIKNHTGYSKKLNNLLIQYKKLVSPKNKFLNLDKFKIKINAVLDNIKKDSQYIYNIFIHGLDGKYSEASKYLRELKLTDASSYHNTNIKVPSLDFAFKYPEYEGNVQLLFDLIVKIVLDKTKKGGKRRSKKRRHKRRRTKKNV
jgi:hypothetical protein